MQRAEQRNEASTAVDDELSQDELLTILSNQRRRFAIHCLKQRDHAELTVSELAEQVATAVDEQADPRRPVVAPSE